MPGLIIIGIGQTMRGDDSVGMCVVKDWEQQYPETAAHVLVSISFQPLPGLGLLDQLSGYETAILVDAVLGGPRISPGSLLYLGPEDLASFTRGTGSAHGWGVAESLKLAETLKRKDIPEQITILGVGGQQVDIGADLSPEVADALPDAVEALNRLVQNWLKTQ
jgi:hydrogenase maturation protease